MTACRRLAAAAAAAVAAAAAAAQGVQGCIVSSGECMPVRLDDSVGSLSDVDGWLGRKQTMPTLSSSSSSMWHFCGCARYNWLWQACMELVVQMAAFEVDWQVVRGKAYSACGA
jgi:hypothetical protein